MKVLVAIKRVVDHAVKVRVNPSTNKVNLTNVKMSINPFCEIAMEEAIRLKEQKIASEVIAVTVGAKPSQEQLRYCLALGADRSILVDCAIPNEALYPLVVAKALKRVVDEEKPDIVFLGKQSIDGDNCQTGSILSGLLDWSEGSCISSLQYKDNQFIVEEETENGRRTLTIPLPAVLTTDLRLNTPRYPKLPDIVKAKKKPMKVIHMDDFLELASREKLISMSKPPQRNAGKMCKDVDELVRELKNRGNL